jgi:hypothetical protein
MAIQLSNPLDGQSRLRWQALKNQLNSREHALQRQCAVAINENSMPFDTLGRNQSQETTVVPPIT